MKELFTMDDFDFKGKAVLVRADLNSPLGASGAIEDSPRMAAHAQTIKELAEKSARVIVLSHQGRKGDADFVPLEGHAKLLERHVGRPIAFVNGLSEPSVLAAIKAVQSGQIILLENTRFSGDETKKLGDLEDYSNVQFVKQLASVCDYFVNDAFSVSHRAQASVVGFPYLLPSCAGRTMQRELGGAELASEKAERPVVYLLGGAKAEDVLSLLEFACTSRRADKVLTSGVLANILLEAKGGINVADSKAELVERAKLALSKYRQAVELPLDLAVEENGERKEYAVGELPQKPAFDIGEKTIASYSKAISSAKTIFVKGPPGVYENPLFEKGTRNVFRAIAANDKCFALFGGGHSSSALRKFGINSSRLHFSLSGGALAEFLEGKKLPGIEALKASYAKFSKK